MSTFTGREADAGELAAATIRRESGQQLVSFPHADHATVAGNRQPPDRSKRSSPDLNVLFSLALARWVAAEQVTVNLVHPGLSWTPMTQSMTRRRCRRCGWSGRYCGWCSGAARREGRPARHRLHYSNIDLEVLGLVI